MTKKKKSVRRRRTTAGSAKKSTRKPTSTRHPAPKESELNRSEVAIASLYAEIYFRRTGVILDGPVDNSWKDVPVLRMMKTSKEVSVRWLEKHDRFGIAVPISYWSDSKTRPDADMEWLSFVPELSEGSTFTRDLLLALDWVPKYLGTVDGHMRYEFSRVHSEAEDISTLKDLIHQEVRSYRSKRSSSRRFRPVFPAPNDFELIAFDLPELPAWALKENWLAKRLIISPVEFRRARNGLAVDTRHLLDYVNWIFSRKLSHTNEEAQVFKMKVRGEIQRFIELLVQAEKSSDLLLSHHGKSSNRPFSLEDTASILGIQSTFETG